MESMKLYKMYFSRKWIETEWVYSSQKCEFCFISLVNILLGQVYKHFQGFCKIKQSCSDLVFFKPNIWQIPLCDYVDLANGLKRCLGFQFCWDTCITPVNLQFFSLPKYVTTLSRVKLPCFSWPDKVRLLFLSSIPVYCYSHFFPYCFCWSEKHSLNLSCQYLYGQPGSFARFSALPKAFSMFLVKLLIILNDLLLI